jgi:hypothetical protein
MSISIQSVSNPPSPVRSQAQAEATQLAPGSTDPSASPAQGADGHLQVPAYFALWLELLELLQKQRSADRTLSTQVGLVTQDLALAQAQYVRNEGGQIFAGALTGAVTGIAIGAAGAMLAHRAFGKQTGSASQQNGSASLERPRSGSVAGAADDIDNMSRPARPDTDGLSEPGEIERAFERSSHTLDRMRFNAPDIESISVPGTSVSRSGSVSSAAGRPEPVELGELDGSTSSLNRMRFNDPDIEPVTPPVSRSGSVSSAGGRPEGRLQGRAEPLESGEIDGSTSPLNRMRFEDPDAGALAPSLSRQGSVRSSTGPASPADQAASPAQPDSPIQPDSARVSDSTRASRRGLIGQMLIGNAASLAAIGAAGGQMSAAVERAGAGLAQTGGMITESTKHNRSEDARNANEAVTRALGALRDQNQDLRQTISQIVSSIRA